MSPAKNVIYAQSLRKVSLQRQGTLDEGMAGEFRGPGMGNGDDSQQEANAKAEASMDWSGSSRQQHPLRCDVLIASILFPAKVVLLLLKNLS